MDLFDNDFITVTGKKQASEHIIKRYGDFGWKLTETKEDKLYGDILHMSFTRPHAIKNKDELQLLQVRLEIAYNNTGKLARKSSHRTLLLATLTVLIVTAFIVGGVFMILNGGLLPIIFGSVACALGAVMALAGGISASRILKKDKAKYARLIDREAEKIDELCNRAKALRGEYEG